VDNIFHGNKEEERRFRGALQLPLMLKKLPSWSMGREDRKPMVGGCKGRGG